MTYNSKEKKNAEINDEKIEKKKKIMPDRTFWYTFNKQEFPRQ